MSNSRQNSSSSTTKKATSSKKSHPASICERPYYEDAVAAFQEVDGYKNFKSVGEVIGGKVKTNLDSGIFEHACAIRGSHVLNATNTDKQAQCVIPKIKDKTVSGADGSQYIYRLNVLIEHFTKIWGPPDYDSRNKKHIRPKEVHGVVISLMPEAANLGFTGHFKISDSLNNYGKEIYWHLPKDPKPRSQPLEIKKPVHEDPSTSADPYYNPNPASTSGSSGTWGYIEGGMVWIPATSESTNIAEPVHTEESVHRERIERLEASASKNRDGSIPIWSLNQTHLGYLPLRISYNPLRESFNYCYRGDDRAPAEIFEKGFKSHGNDKNLLKHILHYNDKSAFISTSAFMDSAIIYPRYPASQTYLYVINQPNKYIDVVSEFNGHPEFETIHVKDFEIAIESKIKSRDIKGAWEVKDKFSGEGYQRKTHGEFIENPNYRLPGHTLKTSLHILGYTLTGVAIVIDGLSLYREFKISFEKNNYSNTYHEAARIAGGWAGATAGSAAGARLGTKLSSNVRHPLSSLIGSFVGGVAGGIWGYNVGSDAIESLLDENKDFDTNTNLLFAPALFSTQESPTIPSSTSEKILGIKTEFQTTLPNPTEAISTLARNKEDCIVYVGPGGKAWDLNHILQIHSGLKNQNFNVELFGMYESQKQGINGTKSWGKEYEKMLHHIEHNTKGKPLLIIFAHGGQATSKEAAELYGKHLIGVSEGSSLNARHFFKELNKALKDRSIDILSFACNGGGASQDAIDFLPKNSRYIALAEDKFPLVNWSSHKFLNTINSRSNIFAINTPKVDQLLNHFLISCSETCEIRPEIPSFVDNDKTIKLRKQLRERIGKPFTTAERNFILNELTPLIPKNFKSENTFSPKRIIKNVIRQIEHNQVFCKSTKTEEYHLGLAICNAINMMHDPTQLPSIKHEFTFHLDNYNQYLSDRPEVISIRANIVELENAATLKTTISTKTTTTLEVKDTSTKPNADSTSSSSTNTSDKVLHKETLGIHEIPHRESCIILAGPNHDRGFIRNDVELLESGLKKQGFDIYKVGDGDTLVFPKDLERMYNHIGKTKGSPLLIIFSHGGTVGETHLLNLGFSKSLQSILEKVSENLDGRPIDVLNFSCESATASREALKILPEHSRYVGLSQKGFKTLIEDVWPFLDAMNRHQLLDHAKGVDSILNNILLEGPSRRAPHFTENFPNPQVATSYWHTSLGMNVEARLGKPFTETEKAFIVNELAPKLPKHIYDTGLSTFNPDRYVENAINSISQGDRTAISHPKHYSLAMAICNSAGMAKNPLFTSNLTSTFGSVNQNLMDITLPKNRMTNTLGETATEQLKVKSETTLSKESNTTKILETSQVKTSFAIKGESSLGISQEGHAISLQKPPCLLIIGSGEDANVVHDMHQGLEKQGFDVKRVGTGNKEHSFAFDELKSALLHLQNKSIYRPLICITAHGTKTDSYQIMNGINKNGTSIEPSLIHMSDIFKEIKNITGNNPIDCFISSCYAGNTSEAFLNHLPTGSRLATTADHKNLSYTYYWENLANTLNKSVSEPDPNAFRLLNHFLLDNPSSWDGKTGYHVQPQVAATHFQAVLRDQLEDRFGKTFSNEEKFRVTSELKSLFPEGEVVHALSAIEQNNRSYILGNEMDMKHRADAVREGTLHPSLLFEYSDRLIDPKCHRNYHLALAICNAAGMAHEPPAKKLTSIAHQFSTTYPGLDKQVILQHLASEVSSSSATAKPNSLIKSATHITETLAKTAGHVAGTLAKTTGQAIVDIGKPKNILSAGGEVGGGLAAKFVATEMGASVSQAAASSVSGSIAGSYIASRLVGFSKAASGVGAAITAVTMTRDWIRNHCSHDVRTINGLGATQAELLLQIVSTPFDIIDASLSGAVEKATDGILERASTGKVTPATPHFEEMEGAHVAVDLAKGTVKGIKNGVVNDIKRIGELFGNVIEGFAAHPGLAENLEAVMSGGPAAISATLLSNSLVGSQTSPPENLKPAVQAISSIVATVNNLNHRERREFSAAIDTAISKHFGINPATNEMNRRSIYPESQRVEDQGIGRAALGMSRVMAQPNTLRHADNCYYSSSNQTKYISHSELSIQQIIAQQAFTANLFLSGKIYNSVLTSAYSQYADFIKMGMRGMIIGREFAYNEPTVAITNAATSIFTINNVAKFLKKSTGSFLATTFTATLIDDVANDRLGKKSDYEMRLNPTSTYNQDLPIHMKMMLQDSYDKIEDAKLLARIVALPARGLFKLQSKMNDYRMLLDARYHISQRTKEFLNATSPKKMVDAQIPIYDTLTEQFLLPILKGTRSGIEGTLDAIMHPIDKVLAPAASLFHDSLLASTQIYPIDIHGNSLSSMLNLQLISDASYGLQSRVTSAAIYADGLLRAEWKDQLEAATSFGVGFYTPGYLVKLGKVIPNYVNYGVPFKCTEFKNIIPKNHKYDVVSEININNVRAITEKTTLLYGIGKDKKFHLALENQPIPSEFVSGKTFDHFIKHDELLQGQNALAAGEVQVKQGKVVEIDNSSGHYCTEGSHLTELVETYFRRNGFYETKGKFIDLFASDKIQPVNLVPQYSLTASVLFLNQAHEKSKESFYFKSSKSGGAPTFSSPIYISKNEISPMAGSFKQVKQIASKALDKFSSWSFIPTASANDSIVNSDTLDTSLVPTEYTLLSNILIRNSLKQNEEKNMSHSHRKSSDDIELYQQSRLLKKAMDEGRAIYGESLLSNPLTHQASAMLRPSSLTRSNQSSYENQILRLSNQQEQQALKNMLSHLGLENKNIGQEILNELKPIAVHIEMQLEELRQEKNLQQTKQIYSGISKAFQAGAMAGEMFKCPELTMACNVAMDATMIAMGVGQLTGTMGFEVAACGWAAVEPCAMIALAGLSLIGKLMSEGGGDNGLGKALQALSAQINQLQNLMLEGFNNVFKNQQKIMNAIQYLHQYIDQDFKLPTLHKLQEIDSNIQNLQRICGEQITNSLTYHLRDLICKIEGNFSKESYVSKLANWMTVESCQPSLNGAVFSQNILSGKSLNHVLLDQGTHNGCLDILGFLAREIKKRVSNFPAEIDLQQLPNLHIWMLSAKYLFTLVDKAPQEQKNKIYQSILKQGENLIRFVDYIRKTPEIFEKLLMEYQESFESIQGIIRNRINRYDYLQQKVCLSVAFPPGSGDRTLLDVQLAQIDACYNLINILCNIARLPTPEKVNANLKLLSSAEILLQKIQFVIKKEKHKVFNSENFRDYSQPAQSIMPIAIKNYTEHELIFPSYSAYIYDTNCNHFTLRGDWYRNNWQEYWLKHPEYRKGIRYVTYKSDNTEYLFTLFRYDIGSHVYLSNPLTKTTQIGTIHRDWKCSHGVDDPEIYSTIRLHTLNFNGQDRVYALKRNTSCYEIYSYDLQLNRWLKCNNGPAWSDILGYGRPEVYETIRTKVMNINGKDNLFALIRNANHVELHQFDPYIDQWKVKASLYKWSNHAGFTKPNRYETLRTEVITIHDKTYLIAMIRNGEYLESHIYNPQNNTWTELPRGPKWDANYDDEKYYKTMRTLVLSTDYQGKSHDVLIVGIRNQEYYEMHCYDHLTKTWQELPHGPKWSDTAIDGYYTNPNFAAWIKMTRSRKQNNKFYLSSLGKDTSYGLKTYEYDINLLLNDIKLIRSAYLTKLNEITKAGDAALLPMDNHSLETMVKSVMLGVPEYRQKLLDEIGVNELAIKPAASVKSTNQSSSSSTSGSAIPKSELTANAAFFDAPKAVTAPEYFKEGVKYFNEAEGEYEDDNKEAAKKLFKNARTAFKNALDLEDLSEYHRKIVQTKLNKITEYMNELLGRAISLVQNVSKAIYK